MPGLLRCAPYWLPALSPDPDWYRPPSVIQHATGNMGSHTTTILCVHSTSLCNMYVKNIKNIHLGLHQHTCSGTLIKGGDYQKY